MPQRRGGELPSRPILGAPYETPKFRVAGKIPRFEGSARERKERGRVLARAVLRLPPHHRVASSEETEERRSRRQGRGEVRRSGVCIPSASTSLRRRAPLETNSERPL